MWSDVYRNSKRTRPLLVGDSVKKGVTDFHLIESGLVWAWEDAECLKATYRMNPQDRMRVALRFVNQEPELTLWLTCRYRLKIKRPGLLYVMFRECIMCDAQYNSVLQSRGHAEASLGVESHIAWS